MARYEWTISCRTRRKVVEMAASVRTGKTTGLSVEFHALSESRANGVTGVREISSRVDYRRRHGAGGQSYDQARAEVRSKTHPVAWWRR